MAARDSLRAIQHCAPPRSSPGASAAPSLGRGGTILLMAASLPRAPDDISVAPYDALLLVSFGGPEQPQDVVPFLRNVTVGRDIPEERLAEVGEHYFRFGGRSPLNDQCRALRAAIEADFAAHGVGVPVYWGNRNWDPYLADTFAQMQADGVTRAAAFVTSAYSSYSGCRQYRENLYDAVTRATAVHVDRLRHYFNHPGFVASFTDSTCSALDRLPESTRDAARLLFVTHSIPLSMASSAGPGGGAYEAQHRSVASLVSEGVASRTGRSAPWDLVYCSRSGPPQVPWLEPDVNDAIRGLAADGGNAVVVVPIGFVSDHMEVIYDLDTEAKATAEDLGLAFARAATPGVHPAFVSLVRDLLCERSAVERGEQVERAAVGELSPSWDACPATCCPNPRRERPALAGAAG
jgi:protoporphyrin/coproporphyrin ferrochelatase